MLAEAELATQFRLKLEKGPVAGFVGQVEKREIEPLGFVQDVEQRKIVLDLVAVRIARFDQENVAGRKRVLFGRSHMTPLSGDDQDELVKDMLMHVDGALMVEVQHLERKGIRLESGESHGGSGGGLRRGAVVRSSSGPLGYLTMSSSSTSKISAAFGGIAWPAPWAP